MVQLRRDIGARVRGFLRGVGIYLTPVRSVRERRILLLLAGAWVLSGFDLGFTLVARAMGLLEELNPVAGWFMHNGGDSAVIVYKLVLMGVGTAILWRFRRSVQAEVSAWIIVGAYVALSFRWDTYYREHRMPDSSPASWPAPAVVRNRTGTPSRESLTAFRVHAFSPVDLSDASPVASR